MDFVVFTMLGDMFSYVSQSAKPYGWPPFLFLAIVCVVAHNVIGLIVGSALSFLKSKVVSPIFSAARSLNHE